MKKVLNKSLSFLLAITIIFGSAYVGVSADDFTYVSDDKGIFDLIYNLNDDGCSYSVTGYVYYKGGSLTIPSTYNGKPVTRIDGLAFEDCFWLTSITIPDSVTSIGYDAFLFCTDLQSVQLSNNLKSIDSKTFFGCKRLRSITIPDSVEYIGKSAFYDCYNLKSVSIGKGVTSIGDNAFMFCRALASVTMADNVSRIGYEAFCGTGITSIKLSKNLKTIHSRAFANSYLKSIEIPESIENVYDDAFYGCNLKEVYYHGSEIERDGIYISPNNQVLLDATWHYAKVSKPATPKVATTNEIGGVQVKWNAVAGATKYVVYRRQGGYNTWVNVGTTTGNTLLDKNVKSGIYYVYSVRAYNNAGQYSDFVTANTQTRKFMATPKLTTIYNHVNGLAIKWNAVDGITKGYRVYRRGAGSTYWTYLGTTKNLYFIDNAVKNKSGEYFRYTVIADGDYHSKFDTTGLYLRRLANPTLTSAVSSSAGITVKWSAVKGTTGYYVYRKTANSTWTRVGTVGGTNNTTFLDKTAKKGTTYTYTVKAVYGATTSAYYSGISCKDKY